MPLGSKAAPGIRRVIRKPPTPASEYEEEERVPTRTASRQAEEAPVRSVSRRAAKAEPEDDEDVVADSVLSGWGGAKQTKADMPSDFAQSFTIPEGDPTIIKFLQHEPFAIYKQHWAEWLPKGSKLSYVCPNTRERKVCPICAKGDRPQAKYCFNIADFTDPENPTNSVLVVGFKLSTMLEKMDADRRNGPLDRADLYFAINKTGAEGSRGRRGGTVQTNIIPVKERDLEQDWDIQPLAEDELNVLLANAYGKADMVSKTTMATLEEVADSMED